MVVEWVAKLLMLEPRGSLNTSGTMPILSGEGINNSEKAFKMKRKYKVLAFAGVPVRRVLVPIAEIQHQLPFTCC